MKLYYNFIRGRAYQESIPRKIQIEPFFFSKKNLVAEQEFFFLLRVTRTVFATSD